MRPLIEEPRAHPRSRGENSARAAAIGPLLGSSPLTRGKRQHDRARGHPGGLIPAHAGKTSTASARPPRTGAHPRSRGENVTTVIASPGSPAHPRSRGENCPAYRWSRTTAGSSPLTRGKPMVSIGLSFFEGLIPAHAGKTGSNPARAGTRRAHPRSRGENLAGAGGLIAVWGSSPLTRGKHLQAHGIDPLAGLIPAHAGKTDWARHDHDQGEAHPRSRGENTSTLVDAVDARGSSPLTRGKREDVTAQV